MITNLLVDLRLKLYWLLVWLHPRCCCRCPGSGRCWAPPPPTSASPPRAPSPRSAAPASSRSRQPGSSSRAVDCQVLHGYFNISVVNHFKSYIISLFCCKYFFFLSGWRPTPGPATANILRDLGHLSGQRRAGICGRGRGGAR